MKNILFLILFSALSFGVSKNAYAENLPPLNKWVVDCKQDPMTDEKLCRLVRLSIDEGNIFIAQIQHVKNSERGDVKNSDYLANFGTNNSCANLEMRVDQNTKIDAVQNKGICFFYLSDSIKASAGDVDVYLPHKDILTQLKNGRTMIIRSYDYYGKSTLFKVDLSDFNNGWEEFQKAIESLNNDQKNTEKE